MNTIHASLHRPVLFAGVEPMVAIAEATAVLGLLIVVGLHVATVGLSLVYLIVVHATLARVTASDPAMAAVYLRSLAYRGYYPPHAHPLARAPRVRPSVARAP